MNHEVYIKRCIELAEKAQGNTYPNPMVGAVIVHQDRIIGEGYHHRAGEPHAEINAIRSVAQPELLPESTIYVSLEPCSHFGKTPPCALKIIEVGFKKVVIGTLDPHEKVSGKGKAMIEAAGIEVVSGVLEKECRALNKRFLTFHEKKRPFITLKWASSRDGFIDRNFAPVAISNPLVSQWVHKKRAEEQAILVGSRTALNDNPSLTTRHYAGQNPIRLLLDFDLKVPLHYAIFNKEAETIIFNQHQEKVEGHLSWVKIRKENAISDLMESLYRLGVQSVLVEGGRQILQLFIEAHLWDEAWHIKNQDLILENGTPEPILNCEFADKMLNIRNNQLMFYKNHTF